MRSPGSVCLVWGAEGSEERRSGGQAGAGGRDPDTCGQAARLTLCAQAQPGASLGTRAHCLAWPLTAGHEADFQCGCPPLRLPGGCCESHSVTQRTAWCRGAEVWRHWRSERPHSQAGSRRGRGGPSADARGQ